MLGLTPLWERLAQAKLAVQGDPLTPPSKADLSSLKILKPRLAIETWLGRRRPDRRIALYNLFNRKMTDPLAGWSVQKTQVEDFLGGSLTYNSHNGTDFIVPPGTLVVAPATGKVLRVSNEFHRGGLKVFMDHGRGLATSYGHLARSLVKVGDLVERGAPLALSGYSGIDALLTFPFSMPHVHFNVWLNGSYTDPFARDGEVPLFRGNQSVGPATRDRDETFAATCFSTDGMARALEGCRDAHLRDELRSIEDPSERAMALLMHLAYFPTRFSEAPSALYEEHFARESRLDLPFSAADFDGLAFD